MSRIRSIKPEFFTSDSVGALTPIARLVFAGLWTLADREGRLQDRPRQIKVKLIPYDDDDIEEVLSTLEKGKFIVRYEVEGEHYIAIPGFARHQIVNNREAESEIPPPPESSEITDTSTRGARVEHASGTRDSEREDASPTREARVPSGREGKGREGNSTSTRQGRVVEDALPLPDWVPKESWADYENFRRDLEKRDKKKPWTPLARKKALSTLEELSGRDTALARAILDQSVLNNWQGLFEVKNFGSYHRAIVPLDVPRETPRGDLRSLLQHRTETENNGPGAISREGAATSPRPEGAAPASAKNSQSQGHPGAGVDRG